MLILMRRTFAVGHFVLCAALVCSAEELPLVTSVEFQPLAAQAARVEQTLSMLGEPLPEADARQLKEAKTIEQIQRVFDKHCLAGVEINPESRVKVQQGPAKAQLVEQGWRAFLIKVHNQAGITAVLAVDSPNAGPIPNEPANAARVRWLDLQMANKQPMKAHLSGLDLEYRVLQIYAKEAGKREGKLMFDVGQGSQDLGFRSEVDILFTIAPAAKVTLRVLDSDDKPTTASFVIRDERQRVYPSQTKRLAPDFFFHPQVYRADGESIALPPGKYTVEYSRGPEYRKRSQSIEITDNAPRTLTFRLERWIDPAKLGWYSGDHHIHAAGCAHYERPTEGVYPQDMMRHVVGEDLKIGSVLTWGPGWYFQKTFFEGKDNGVSTEENRIRYDVEVSGHPSSHTGHLLLLRLKDQDYPGTKRIEDWPSWGLALKQEKLPSYEMPPFDGIGANEYVVTVTHGVPDVISTVDTPYAWELNVWYHALNVGYRTRISGETDFPCIYGDRVGIGRSYVRQAKLDYDDWVQGLREGRNYASDGKSHLIDFRVNDIEMGSGKDVELPAAGTVKVTANVAAFLEQQPDEAIRKLRYDQKPYWDVERARIGNSRKVPVEVVVNGRAVARKEIDADGELRNVTFDIPIERSSWVCLRILPSSHTNPVWVTVEGKPVRASRRSAQWLREAVDVCFRQKVGRVRLTEQGEMVRAYDHARAEYDRLIAESTVE
jgi:hypothetical protein